MSTWWCWKTWRSSGTTWHPLPAARWRSTARALASSPDRPEVTSSTARAGGWACWCPSPSCRLASSARPGSSQSGWRLQKKASFYEYPFPVRIQANILLIDELHFVKHLFDGLMKRRKKSSAWNSMKLLSQFPASILLLLSSWKKFALLRFLQTQTSAQIAKRKNLGKKY